jgi:FdhD protein
MIAKEELFVIRFGDRLYEIKCSPTELEYLAKGLAFVEGLDGDFEIERIEIDEFCRGKVECNERWSLDEIEGSLKLIDLNDPTKAHHTAVIVGKSGMIARAVDVSRHNAILKVIGRCLNTDFSRVFLLVSSRVTFDVALSCYKAKIPVLVTKKAVTDLAIDLCRKTGITLVSFGSRIVVGDAVECSHLGWRKG